MRETICKVAICLCLIFIHGVFGGIEHGESLLNLFWCIPAILVAKVCAVVGGLIDF